MVEFIENYYLLIIAAMCLVFCLIEIVQGDKYGVGQDLIIAWLAVIMWRIDTISEMMKLDY